jgi:hypothetical protein
VSCINKPLSRSLERSVQCLPQWPSRRTVLAGMRSMLGRFPSRRLSSPSLPLAVSVRTNFLWMRRMPLWSLLLLLFLGLRSVFVTLLRSVVCSVCCLLSATVKALRSRPVAHARSHILSSCSTSLPRLRSGWRVAVHHSPLGITVRWLPKLLPAPW